MIATYFLTPQDGWALAGRSGALYRTRSGGAAWQKVGRLTHSNFADIDFVNPQDGWVLAPGFFGQVALLRTTDGGIRWSSARMPRTYALAMFGLPDRALSFVSPKIGYLDTNSGVYKTTDGGATWRIVP